MQEFDTIHIIPKLTEHTCNYMQGIDMLSVKDYLMQNTCMNIYKYILFNLENLR